MRINTTYDIFKLCKKQFKAAILTDGAADIYVLIDAVNYAQHEFNLVVDKNGIATVLGGCQQSALWGFYEYLERFYGAKWYSPWKTEISSTPVNPIKKTQVAYKNPFRVVQWHPTLPKNVKEWLAIHRCIGLDEPISPWSPQDKLDNWAEIHADKPQIFAQNWKGQTIKNNNLKYKLDNPTYLDLVIKQAKSWPSKYYSLTASDGVCDDSKAIPKPDNVNVTDEKWGEYIWKGMVNMSDYYAKYYGTVAKNVPDKTFDILAYSTYWKAPKSKFDGSRFRCFYVPEDITEFLEWKWTGCDMYWRPNIWHRPMTDVQIVKEATIFSRFRYVGISGYVMDGFMQGGVKNDYPDFSEESWQQFGLRYYLHALQTRKMYVNIQDVIKEWKQAYE
jgi:hypothetical protein